MLEGNAKLRRDLASARLSLQTQLLGTVSLTMSWARHHLTNLNSAWKTNLFIQSYYS